VILVLEDGVIAERGTHAALIARGGLYHYLARRQLELCHALEVRHAPAVGQARG
jgi:hypothetical protein